MYKLEFVHYQLCVPDTRAGPHPRGASLSPSPVLIYHLCAAAGFSFRFKTPMDFCTNKVNLCLARAVTIPVPAKCSQSSRTSWKFKRVSWGFAQRCPVCVCWSPSEALQKSAGGRGEPGDLQREMKRPLCESRPEALDLFSCPTVQPWERKSSHFAGLVSSPIPRGLAQWLTKVPSSVEVE